MKKNTEKFTESLDLEVPELEEAELYSRRVASYSVKALKAATPVDRIYINYPGFKKVVTGMDRVFQLAREMEIPQGLILTGPTGSGKTAAFRYFRDTLPSSSLFAPGFGAVGLRCPKRPSVGQFVAGYLKAVRYPFAHGTPQQLYIRRGLVFDSIKQKGTRLIFVDEVSSIQSTRRNGSANPAETDISEFFRELVDECRVGLVFSGPPTLESIVDTDKALASRLPVMERLEPFPLDESWIGLLHAIVKQCDTFDIQFFNQIDAAKLLHAATRGNLRDLKRLIVECILIAFDAGNASSDQQTLSKAIAVVFGSSNPRSHVGS